MEKYFKKDIGYRGARCCFWCNNCISEGDATKCFIVKDYETNAHVDTHHVCDHWEKINYTEE